MWALRRAPNPLKSQHLGARIARVCGVKSELPNGFMEDGTRLFEPRRSLSYGSPSLKRFYYQDNGYSSQSHLAKCGFSSQAGAKSNGEEDELDDGFSELDGPDGADAVAESSVNGEKTGLSDSEADVSDVDVDEESPEKELGLLPDKEKSPSKKAQSELFEAIIAARSIEAALEKWVKEGKDLEKDEIWLAMSNLRARRLYGRALQLSEWLEKNGRLELGAREYASRVDLIAKVRGLHRAEIYMGKIPESMRTELVYRTYLANCTSAMNVKRAEQTFNKMRDLEFPVTAFACNQLLLLYKKFDKKKIADVLLLMEKENVAPTSFTYRILIDIKGQSNDIEGMEQIVEAMKTEGVELDFVTRSVLARHYVSAGEKEKAERVLKDMEGGDLRTRRQACRLLLPRYAELGKVDDVKRVWEACEQHPQSSECIAAIEAWGKLKKVEEAEAVFDIMVKRWKKLSAAQFTALLKVYADNKMLSKGKDLLKRMASNDCKIGPVAWDAIVKLYVEAGEVEKADSILQKATKDHRMKPMYLSFMTILKQYAKRGDVHNAEKLFQQMRQHGYTGRATQYLCLLDAYINAKSPAYGMRERMKADNLFPNKALAALLVEADPFKKNPVSDLLD